MTEKQKPPVPPPVHWHLLANAPAPTVKLPAKKKKAVKP